jgi:alpha-galactosidase
VKAFVGIGLILFAASGAASEPPNAPAVIEAGGYRLVVRYHGETILSARIDAADRRIEFQEVKDRGGEAWNQALTLTAADGEPFTLAGRIEASDESFPCEADRRPSGTVMVRHQVGLGRSLLNRAVYDRKWDWLLSVDHSYTANDLAIEPLEATPKGNRFRITVRGDQVTLRFRPRYYQKHRGLEAYRPWTYRPWPRPVAGWCSWFAFKSQVTEADIQETARTLAETMRPFGLEYLQIDDGYQQESAEPEKWLRPNDKFPSGMDGLARFISAQGFKPGIWTNVAFVNGDYARSHKDLFVTERDGKPAQGRWIGYILDGSKKAAIDTLVRPVYAGFRRMGWRYFKLDALRHLRYEGYNSHSGHFSPGVSRTEALRRVVQAVRDEIGPDNFLLACWGIRPELIGIVDGCRIGNDGYGMATLTQYNSFNNVVWLNDPDHIELTEAEAYRSCMATSLTGSLFMLTDKPAVYRTAIIEPARRSLPVLPTRPAQVFDVDPSCSNELRRVDTEMSGSGERVFDASRASPYDLFLLEISKPFEDWLVLGRAGEKTPFISFRDLGLRADRGYAVFEFWSKRYLGVFRDGFDPGRIDPGMNCQVFAIREQIHRPQLLASSRHISCGGLELEGLRWEETGVLAGTSSLVAADPYTLYVLEPAGFAFKVLTAPGAEIVANRLAGSIRSITLRVDRPRMVTWRIEYGMR